MNSTRLQEMKTKIAGLLAKAERTDNEHERDAYNAKAESLMLKMGIEAAELEAGGVVNDEAIIEVKIPFTGIYAVTMPSFVAAVARAMGGIEVLGSSSGKTRYAYVIGHKSDVERMEMLIASLQLQSLTAMKRWWKGNEERTYLTAMQAYKARRQFIFSFGIGAADRIRSERTEQEAEVSTGAALVLVNKKEKVTSWMNQQHNVSKGRGMHGGGAGAGSAGRSAGRQANVGTTAVGGGRAALR